jgi:hypothetical protein
MVEHFAPKASEARTIKAQLQSPLYPLGSRWYITTLAYLISNTVTVLLGQQHDKIYSTDSRNRYTMENINNAFCSVLSGIVTSSTTILYAIRTLPRTCCYWSREDPEQFYTERKKKEHLYVE